LRSDDSRERSAEALEVLVRAWTEEPFVYRGKHFQVSLPALRPRPYQRPHPPIWRSAVAPASFREYGRLGAPIMMSRVPIARLRERLTSYEQGLAEGPHDDQVRACLRRQAALWRHVYVGESQQEADDALGRAVLQTRQHMLHARSAYNPDDFTVDPALVNPYNDPRVSDVDGVRWSLDTGALCGTAGRVAEQIAELRDAGVHHLFCQLSFGYLPHEKIMASMRRFGEAILPRFPER